MKHREPHAYEISEAQIISESRHDGGTLSQPDGQGGGLNFHEFLFILFSHKWKILIFGVSGLIAAACLYFLKDPLYISQAKLLVHYVVDTRPMDQLDNQISSSGRNMEAALNNEVEILTSWDLAKQVVDSGLVDLDKLIPDAEEPGDPILASLAIKNGLEVMAPKNTSVLWVSYKHPDPDVPVSVLKVLVDKYFDKHLSTHRTDATIFLEKEINKVKDRLETAESSITGILGTIGSIEDARSTLNARQLKAAEALVEAKADLAMQALRVEGLEESADGADPEASTSEDPATESDPKPNAGLLADAPSSSDIENYSSLLAELSILKQRKTIEGLDWKPGSQRMRTLQAKIDEIESKRAKMLEKFPALNAIAGPSGSPTENIQPPSDPRLEMVRYNMLKARVDSINEELTLVRNGLMALTKQASDIAPFQRAKEAAELRLRELEVAAAKASSDAALKSNANLSGLPNIKPVQEASLPAPIPADWVKNASLALAFGGFGLGIGLALLIEMILDRSVKRPQEFESRLRLPLMLSIPFLAKPEGGEILAIEDGEPDEYWEGAKSKSEPGKKLKQRPGPTLTPWDPNHFIRPFADAVRDRLGYHFESNNLTHKPKLIAVTGFSDGAGTSSIACGLAASFAETGDGKILYVDLNSDGSSDKKDPLPNPDGSPGTKLQATGGEMGLEEQQENLFIARVGPSASNGNGRARAFAPSKLYDLIPQFKSSDFDYIIFDMPPLGPTSPTLAMAGFMDKTLMVVDAGKTNRDVIKRGYRELVAGKADVSTVLNKTRENLPTWLQG